MLRNIKSEQRSRRDIHLRVVGTGTAEITARMDQLHATLVDDGVGLYTITLRVPFAEPPVVQITVGTTLLFAGIVTVTASAVQIQLRDTNTQAATDGIFHISLFGTHTTSRS